MKKLISIAGIGLLIVMITSILPVFASNWGEVQVSVSDKAVELSVVTFNGAIRTKDFSGKDVTGWTAIAYVWKWDGDEFVLDHEINMAPYLTKESKTDSQVKLYFDIEALYDLIDELQYDAEGNIISGEIYGSTGVVLYTGITSWEASDGPGFVWRRR